MPNNAEQQKKHVVEFDQVSFAYPGTDQLILKDITLRVPKGKVTALIGGSGSGKTTLMRLIGGLYRASTGSVRFNGVNVAEVPEKELNHMRRKMGLLLQFGALFTDMSVFDNVAFPLREHTNLTPAMIKDIVMMKLNAVGLRGAHNLMPSQISGGMARRVALARAIVMDPSLMMYDEPFTGLDPIALTVTANLIKTLNDALGLSTIIVTHDIDEAFEISDYVCIIASGKVIEEGTPADIRASENRYVQQFLRGYHDGEIPFHYPSQSSLASDFGMSRLYPGSDAKMDKERL